MSSSVEKGENVFFSPASIFAALPMTYCCAREDTAKQMKTVMSLDGNPDDTHLHAAVSEVKISLSNISKRRVSFFILDQIITEQTEQIIIGAILHFLKEPELTEQTVAISASLLSISIIH